jgi:hypothetical protein
MKVGLIRIIPGTHCGWHPELPGQQGSEGILKPGKLVFGSVFRGSEAVMLPPGERFNRDFFIDEVFERYDEDRSETRNKNRSYGTVVHIGNTRPHLAQSKSGSMVIHRFAHLHYYPGIVRCGFWLFRYFKMKLDGIFFDIPAALWAEVEQILREISITE